MCNSNPSDIVTFIVGSKQEKFIVHKEFACRHSEVLRAAFNGPFVEGATGTYTLEDTETEAFRMFTEYLYRDTITLQLHNANPEDNVALAEGETHASRCSQQDAHLVSLWLLGDRFLITKLQNQAIDYMQRIFLSCGIMQPGMFVKIYNSTQAGSPLRRLAVDQCCWGKQSDYISENSNCIPSEMFVDIAMTYRNSAPPFVCDKNRARISISDYHVQR